MEKKFVKKKYICIFLNVFLDQNEWAIFHDTGNSIVIVTKKKLFVFNNESSINGCRGIRNVSLLCCGNIYSIVLNSTNKH